MQKALFSGIQCILAKKIDWLRTRNVRTVLLQETLVVNLKLMEMCSCSKTFLEERVLVYCTVFQTHSQKPELAVRLARQMTHSLGTARKVYNCCNAEKNSSDVTAEVGEKSFFDFIFISFTPTLYSICY